MPPRPRKSHPLDLSFCNVTFFLVVPAFNFSLSMVLAIMTWCFYFLVVPCLLSEVRFSNCVLSYYSSSMFLVPFQKSLRVSFGWLCIKICVLVMWFQHHIAAFLHLV